MLTKARRSTLLFLLIPALLPAQDSLPAGPAGKVKKGWSLGALPVVAYNTDLGTQYGAMASLYDYGDGTTYPNYKKMFRGEVSRFTKGTGFNQFFFDTRRFSKRINLRFTADLSYLTDKACDFYGFNGAAAAYRPAFTDDGDPAYISRVFYKYDRKFLRFTADFLGQAAGPYLRFLAGFSYFGLDIGTVDIDRLNRGKPDRRKLPDTALLYDKYVAWGLIPGDEARGGRHSFIKLGLVYDSRDNEANASRGIWTELLLMAGPGFLGNGGKGLSKLVFIHRQYFDLWRRDLTFACRLGYQGTVSGYAPFYLQSLLFSSFSSVILVEGLGGSKTLRGILRNRLAGDGVAYANAELRWKFWKTVIKNQNLYLALSPFSDFGQVVQEIPADASKVPATERTADYFTGRAERLHFTLGFGFHAALNENFVLCCDYGRALDPEDGNSGLYIGVNWLF